MTDEQTGVQLRVDRIDDPIEHLVRGEIEVDGRMPYSSNASQKGVRLITMIF